MTGQEIVNAAAAQLAALKFPRFSPKATPDEAEDAQEFLRDLCKIFDPIIAEVGSEALSCGAINDIDRRACFVSQMANALEGDAVYSLQSYAEDQRGHLEEDGRTPAGYRSYRSAAE